jgi:hypothetical protein
VDHRLALQAEVCHRAQVTSEPEKLVSHAALALRAQGIRPTM